MPKIIILDPTERSAVAFYRSVGPFSYLYRLNEHITVDYVKTPYAPDWDFLGYDIFYAQRPYAPDHLEAINAAKRCNLKIWVDTDDLLHDIPEYNPNNKVFNNPKTKYLDVNKKAIQIADIVTVTTEKLKEYYSVFNENIHIIENAHNDYAFPFEKFLGKGRNDIFWRGSDTHRADIISVAPQMKSVSINHEDWIWSFMGGGDMWYITELFKAKKARKLPLQPLPVYFQVLRTIGSSIMINPLLNNDFNISKSNISWIEGTYGGMVVIGPDLPEFNKPGCLCYKDTQQFEYYLEKCIQSKSFREENYTKSYKYIKENLLLSKVNQKRIDLINKLSGGMNKKSE